MELSKKINQMEVKNNINVEKIYNNGFKVLNKIEMLENKNNLNNNINNDNRVMVLFEKIIY